MNGHTDNDGNYIKTLSKATFGDPAYVKENTGGSDLNDGGFNVGRFGREGIPTPESIFESALSKKDNNNAEPNGIGDTNGMPVNQFSANR